MRHIADGTSIVNRLLPTGTGPIWNDSSTWSYFASSADPTYTNFHSMSAQRSVTDSVAAAASTRAARHTVAELRQTVKVEFKPERRQGRAGIVEDHDVGHAHQRHRSRCTACSPHPPLHRPSRHRVGATATAASTAAAARVCASVRAQVRCAAARSPCTRPRAASSEAIAHQRHQRRHPAWRASRPIGQCGRRHGGRRRCVQALVLGGHLRA